MIDIWIVWAVFDIEMSIIAFLLVFLDKRILGQT